MRTYQASFGAPVVLEFFTDEDGEKLASFVDGEEDQPTIPK